MFEPLIERAKHAVSGPIEKLGARMVFAIPLLVAAGFATAAVTIKLIELYGGFLACLAVAAGYFVLALITAAVVFGKVEADEQKFEAAQQEAAEQPSNFADLIPSDPMALLSSLATAVSVLRMLGRNTSLLLMALAVGIYIWARPSSDAMQADAATGAMPPAE